MPEFSKACAAHQPDVPCPDDCYFHKMTFVRVISVPSGQPETMKIRRMGGAQRNPSATFRNNNSCLTGTSSRLRGVSPPIPGFSGVILIKFMKQIQEHLTDDTAMAVSTTGLVKAVL